MAEKTASLTVLGGPFAGTRCALPESGTITIGSAQGSTLQLDLATVSPYHARIEVAAGRVTVHDTGAERALHVNDNPLEPGGTVLRNGDILWLGAPGEEDVVMLQCVLPRRPVEAPLPPPEPPAPLEAPAGPSLLATPGPATPTPEIETQALWSSADTTEAPPAEPEASETVADVVSATAPETVVAEAAEPAPEGAPDTARDEDLVFVEPSFVGASETEVTAAIQEGEEVVFAEEAEAVVEATEVEASPSPTILTASPQELAEPQAVSIDFGEGVAIAPEPAVTPALAVAPEPLPPAPAAPTPPPPPPLPPAHGHASPIAAKPVGSMPPPTAPPPAAPPRPAPAPPAPRPARPPAPAARRETRPPAPHAAPPAHAPHPPPRATPARSAPVAAAEGPEVIEAEPRPVGSRQSALLALAGAGGVLVLAGVVWAAWHFLASRPAAPRPRPTPIVRATAPPATAPTPTTLPVAVEPTAEPVAPTPIGTPTPAAPGLATPTPTLAPTPRPTPTATTKSTPTPAAARPTPTPAGPTAEALMAQQRAQEAQSLLTQAGTALRAKQYDEAVAHLDGVLRLDPANAEATTLRADAVRRRDLARRRFAPGKTAVQGQKAQKAGGLAGFDTGDADLRSSDFLGRVEFEMSPPSGIEPGDAWTLKVYVVNEGKKPIRVNGLVLGTTVNGAGSGGPLPPRAREVAPQQRSLVAETNGTWTEGTTSWTAEVTVTGGKGESLKNSLTWR